MWQLSDVVAGEYSFGSSTKEHGDISFMLLFAV